jgi:hypothetical protein
MDCPKKQKSLRNTNRSSTAIWPRDKRKRLKPAMKPTSPYRILFPSSKAAVLRLREMFGSIIPSSMLPGERGLYPSLEIIPGRRRTAYFYKQMAIKLRQGARAAGFWFKGAEETHLNLAKSYFKTYRQMIETMPAGQRFS